MAVKERLICYVKYKKITNSDFCRAINVSMAYITSMRKSIQPDKIESITLNYPDLNIDWLLTGQGEMLKEDTTPSKESYQPVAIIANDNVIMSREVFNLILSQQETLSSQQRTIENLTRKE